MEKQPKMYFDPTAYVAMRDLAGRNEGTVSWDDNNVAAFTVNAKTMYYKVDRGQVWEYNIENGTLGKKAGTIVNDRIDVTDEYFQDTFFDNSDIVTTRLSNPNFLEIVDGSITYYGGDQEWFSRYTQQFGGCGPIAAANILAYLAMTNPELANLYSYDTNNMTQSDFAKFMEEVYTYVTPFEIPIFSSLSDKKGSQVGIPSFGIPFMYGFAKAVEKFARNKGINLEAGWSNEVNTTFDAAVNYIREGLKKDSPVALVNGFNPVDMQWTDPVTNKSRKTTYEQHWVTITGMIKNKKTGEVTLEVSSWGGKAALSFTALYNNMDWNEIFFPTGIIYFEFKK